jgi:hypothetical protein
VERGQPVLVDIHSQRKGCAQAGRKQRATEAREHHHDHRHGNIRPHRADGLYVESGPTDGVGGDRGPGLFYADASHEGVRGCLARGELYVDDLRDNVLELDNTSTNANNVISSHLRTSGCTNPLT